MSSLSQKDRASLCSFSFADGRQCRTPRAAKHPRFCFYHAQKEARARAAQKLGKDLTYFFSGDYLSACDLSTALGRLIAAVLRGDVKPRAARTVAYLAQTLLQTIHISQHEYINAFGTNAWRQSIRNSVNGNHDYLFPADPKPKQTESPQPQPQQPAWPSAQPQPQPTQTAVNCHSSLTTRHFLKPHRCTLLYPAPAPNSFSRSWPVGTCPDPVGSPAPCRPPRMSNQPTQPSARAKQGRPLAPL